MQGTEFSLNSVFKYVELSWIWIWSTILDCDELKQANQGMRYQVVTCVAKEKAECLWQLQLIHYVG